MTRYENEIGVAVERLVQVRLTDRYARAARCVGEADDGFIGHPRAPYDPSCEAVQVCRHAHVPVAVGGLGLDDHHDAVVYVAVRAPHKLHRAPLEGTKDCIADVQRIVDGEKVVCAVALDASAKPFLG